MAHQPNALRTCYTGHEESGLSGMFRVRKSSNVAKSSLQCRMLLLLLIYIQDRKKYYREGNRFLCPDVVVSDQNLKMTPAKAMSNQGPFVKVQYLS